MGTKRKQIWNIRHLFCILQLVLQRHPWWSVPARRDCPDTRGWLLHCWEEDLSPTGWVVSLSGCRVLNQALIFTEKGVVAIFGPLSKTSSEHIRSITDSMEIPFIETRWNYRSQKVMGKTNILSMFRYIFHKWKAANQLLVAADKQWVCKIILMRTVTGRLCS